MINESGETSEIFCRLCHQTFFKSSEQLIHKQEDHNAREDQDALKLNLTDLTVEDFCHFCEVCGLKFLTNNSLRVHKRDMHKMGLGRFKTKTKRRSFSCKLCYKEYEKQESLRNHKYREHMGEVSEYFNIKITEHLLKYQCHECNLKFLTESLLEKHKGSHMKSSSTGRL